MTNKLIKIHIAALLAGFFMWVVGGLWHNLILPAISNTAEAHHEGLVIALISYFILAGLMALIYSLIPLKGNVIIAGLKIGIITGVIWVFPHGLAMAGAHDTSILYEIKNTLYHVFEQGLGGILIAIIWENRPLNRLLKAPCSSNPF